jgi:hypothetical protein
MIYLYTCGRFLHVFRNIVKVFLGGITRDGLKTPYLVIALRNANNIFVSETPLFVSNSSFNSFSFFGRQNQMTLFRAEGGDDDETEAD